ncbi:MULTISPECIES: helix-turn-helix domain-containing protein [Sphingobacterium]|uniref:Helix-turn-helix transcriptional regulator n=1 Tax=Sphingobacterium tenebrionis TaxID=3111775 RepID=A0ABU8I5Y8_9SPHI|nr:helix-turn-helix transcriptional regulator [Sphingobacterium sp. CZ-2]
MKNSGFSKSDQEISIFKKSDQHSLSVTYDYVQPMRIRYLDPVEEITIYFKPFGLNQFLPEISSIYNNSGICVFENDHYLYKDLLKLMDEIEDQYFIPEIESYLVSKLVPQSDLLIEQLLDLLSQDLSISQIAEEVGFSRQYISRYFKNMIGKTPNSFRKIQRFRNAIQPIKTTSSLTDLGNQVGFFDQSHFIKDFKSITSITPKDFFKKVFLDEKNIWLHI